MKPETQTPLYKWGYTLGMLVIFFGCTLQDQDDLFETSANKQLLSEAKSWFIHQTELDSGPNSRVVTFIEGEPVWNKAKEHFYMGKPALEIPVRLNVKNLFSLKNEQWKEQAGDYRVLLFRIGPNAFEPYLMKVESEEDSINPKFKNVNKLSLMEIPSDFSGNYSFFHLDGRFVGSWIIEKGERIKSVSFSKPASTKSDTIANTRVSGWTYNCTVTTYTTYVQAGTGEPQIVERYETYECMFALSMAPTGPEDTRGGEHPGCYEPHPNFEGLVVPCNDEPDPCNNFEDLVDKVLNTEGGFVNDPIDKGGATNKGIAWKTRTNAAQPILGKEPTLENLENITVADAKAIYKVLYWDSIRLSEIEDGDLRWLLFDFHINSGPNAIYQLQELLNQLGADLTVDGIIGTNTLNFINDYENSIELYNEYKATRISFLENIVTTSVNRYLARFPNATESELKSKTQRRFRDGWINRVEEFIEKTVDNYLNVNC
ncbi:glycoside hydrolase family 108 protein [Algoriphagus sp. Y33]|uniref:glycoside hydrolase family 108 protein n=1 Tax=Algoriphagus sp. Y33 TaxID=2772483 RepID=UPI0017810D9D|nr:glycosyl hydrolase 108 family protein [Algoriphagus sp. Y33]